MNPFHYARTAALGAVLAASAYGLAGCDASSVEEAAPAGPTVRFGAANATVVEGRSLRIPVILTGNDAATAVTVEVIYARGASTAVDSLTRRADGGVDSTDFSGLTTSAGLRRATLTFDAAVSDTQYVEIAARADRAAEQTEQVVLALQRATNAALGTPREFTLNIGVLPLAQVRTQTQGQTVTAEGVVTRVRGRQLYIQDGTTALAVFAPAGTALNAAIASGAVAQGDRLQLAGRLTEFRTLLQIDQVAEFAVLARAQALPAAQTITAAQLNAGAAADTYEAELVRLTGVTIDPAGDAVFQAGKSYTATDAAGTTFILRTPSGSDTNVTNQPIPTGAVTFTGVVGQFDGVNQLLVVNASDLQ